MCIFIGIGWQIFKYTYIEHFLKLTSNSWKL